MAPGFRPVPNQCAERTLTNAGVLAKADMPEASRDLNRSPQVMTSQLQTIFGLIQGQNRCGPCGEIEIVARGVSKVPHH